MEFRRVLVPLLVISVLLIGCGTGGATLGQQDAGDDVLFQDLQDVISATGEIQPARRADLSFPVGGNVKTIYVDEGQTVTAGESLVELDTVQLARGVAEAQAALTAAEADLARVKAGAHPEDISAAQQAVVAAEANVGVAEAQLQAAQASLGQAQSGVSIAEAQVAIAQSGVRVAEAELTRAQAGASEQDLSVARSGLEKAQAAVALAQSDYDRAGRKADSAEALALERATLDLQAAQAQYNELLVGPRTTDLAPLRAGIESAKSQVPLAEAQVMQAKSAVAQAEVAVIQAEAGLVAATAQAGQAQATLDRLEAGATTEEIGVAEAAVTRAREGLRTAQDLRAQAVLTAPFDGTVGLIRIKPGEEVLPGQSILMLGDLATLRIETTDLDELDVARVQPEQHVDLTFDALPERVLSGRVVSIAPMATPGQTSTTYRVIIEFEETDPALRWGMTAFVDIQVD